MPGRQVDPMSGLRPRLPSELSVVDVNSKEENHPISQSWVDIILEYGVICCTYITVFFGIFHFGTVDRTTK